MPVLTGEYLGQTPPGTKAALFAPGIITTGMATRDVAMTPDGKEFYYCVFIGNFAYTAILVTKQVNGRWTAPEVAPFAAHPEYMDLEPAISPDGQKFYFLSTRPREVGGEAGNQDIWVMDRIENDWGEPYNLGAPINSDAPEYFPSVTRDGTIYFTREAADRSNAIYRSRLLDGEYAEPERLGDETWGRSQFNAFIAPDESYLIICTFGREDSIGSVDYYVVFRSEDDTWSDPINLGDEINTPGGNEYSPYVSPDGRYFFFMASRAMPASDMEELTLSYLKRLHNEPRNSNPDLYWIDAGFIEDLRPE
ncbi:MAG: hypothetical protein GY856_27715 [bacterium]|nr:hypothetical protein [bacterium]